MDRDKPLIFGKVEIEPARAKPAPDPKEVLYRKIISAAVEHCSIELDRYALEQNWSRQVALWVTFGTAADLVRHRLIEQHEWLKGEPGEPRKGTKP